jgi:hypothetical protein
MLRSSDHAFKENNVLQIFLARVPINLKFCYNLMAPRGGSWRVRGAPTPTPA